MRRNTRPGRRGGSLSGMAIVLGLSLIGAAAAGEPASIVGPGRSTGQGAPCLAAVVRLQQDGKQLFAKHCVSCHGAEGRGDGVAGRGMKPPPPDIANADFLATIPDDSIATVIRDGRGGMKPLGKVLTRQQIRSVIAYLRELGKARAR